MTAVLFLIAHVAGAECLPSEPAELELSGKLTEVVFPGPPEYESVDQGDVAETALILELDAPICLTEEPGLTSRTLHLVLLGDIEKRWARMEKLVGRRIACSGSAWNWQTAHHHTPILLTVKECNALER